MSQDVGDHQPSNWTLRKFILDALAAVGLVPGGFLLLISLAAAIGEVTRGRFEIALPVMIALAVGAILGGALAWFGRRAWLALTALTVATVVWMPALWVVLGNCPAALIPPGDVERLQLRERPGYQFWCVDVMPLVSAVLPLAIVALFVAASVSLIAGRIRNRSTNEKGLA